MAAVDKNNNSNTAPVGSQPAQQANPSQNPAADQFKDQNNDAAQQTTSIVAEPINLLPPEFKPKESILNFSKRLNKVAVAFLAVFLVLGVTSGAATILLTLRTSSARQEVEELSSQVSALEQTEQRLILVKDRIEKINKIQSGEDSYDTVLVFKDLNDDLPSGLEIVEAEVSESNISTTILFGNSSDLARFLAQSISEEQYRLVKINTLGISQDGRLSMDIEFAAI